MDSHVSRVLYRGKGSNVLRYEGRRVGAKWKKRKKEKEEKRRKEQKLSDPSFLTDLQSQFSPPKTSQ